MYFHFSVIEEILKKSKLLNITYHPILDNYQEFDDVPRQVFNEYQKFEFAGLIDTSFLLCATPCVTVEYKMTMDKFFMSSEEEMIHVSGGTNRGVVMIQLSRTVQYEVVSDNMDILRRE